MNGACDIVSREHHLVRCGEALAGALDRLGRDQHEGNDAGHSTAVHPVVDGAALYQDVSSLEMNHGPVEVHVDLAGDDDRVVDRLGAMVAWRYPRSILDQPEHRAIGINGCDGAGAAVGVTAVVGWEFAGGPDYATRMRRPPRDHILAHLVNADDRAAILVVAGDDAADLQGHRNSFYRMESALKTLATRHQAVK